MATYQQGDDHDRITHVDMLNLLREDMREGFAQQREAFNTRFDSLDDKVDTKVDALDSKVESKFDVVDTRFDGVDDKIDAVDSKVDAVDGKVETHIAEHTEQANESKTGRRWLIGIGIGVGITVSGLVGQYLPAIIRALQSGP